MPATFLIADTHLGHDMVARLRGFADALMMKKHFDRETYELINSL